jgi:hypothetical protein
MAIAPFLAMTAAEMRNGSALPPKIAWMACHFSPYGTGLSNLSRELPPGSLLILDDITPPRGHDPILIAEQLTACAESFRCCGILLDFQRPNSPETAALAKQLSQVLPCPTAVSDCYAGNLSCPVFLPPLPPSVPLPAYLASWQGREIWLELGLDGEILTLTETGCNVTPLPCPDRDADGFTDEKLHCHYCIETKEKSASFTLWRTKNDMLELLEDAETLGISCTLGLYQELFSRNEPRGTQEA